jgi:hypothetical protein
MDTDLSAFSILATRDWLEPICFASCCCRLQLSINAFGVFCDFLLTTPPMMT